MVAFKILDGIQCNVVHDLHGNVAHFFKCLSVCTKMLDRYVP